MSKAKHSATPWRVCGRFVNAECPITGCDLLVAEAQMVSADPCDAHDNAEHIALAVNCHDDLLKVCELLLWNFPDLDEILGGQSGDEARELIKLARAAKAKATDGEGKP